MKSVPLSTSWLVLVLAFLLGTAPAQKASATHLNDPANLAGECVSPQDLADTLPIDHGTPALQQLLRKLRTRASFMLIVAHPDDEDGGLLTYLSRGQGARVAMLTLTRGEGGQNLMSADFDDALGLIRTQELLAADRYMGVDQFFGTEVDFGFSKTKDESFAKWTHERVLYDAVRAVRLYRPLVIASVFIGAPSDGHGQHQVSGQIAQEVFNAAGDPKVFPDQIAAGLQPWQPLKVYARVPFARIDEHGMFDYATNQYTPARFTNYVTGKVTTTTPKENVVIPEGEPATYTAANGTKTPIPGMDGLSYIQFGRKGLALQKTQIGNNARLASPGPHDVSYHRYGSHLNQPDGDDSPLESSLFEGIDTSLAGIGTLAPDSNPAIKVVLKVNLSHLAASIDEAQRAFVPNHPELAAPALQEALRTADFLLSQVESFKPVFIPADQKSNLLHELRIKRVQLNNALVLAHGYELSAVLSDHPSHVPHSEVSELFHTLEKSAGAEIRFSVVDPNGAHLLRAGLMPAVGIVVSQTGPFQHPITITPWQHEIAASFIANFSTGQPASQPYFSRPNIEQPYYDVSDPNLRNAPAAPPTFTAYAVVDDEGLELHLNSHLIYPPPDPATTPVGAVSPISISISRSVKIISLNPSPLTVLVDLSSPIRVDRPNTDRLHSPQLPTETSVRIDAPQGWRVQPASIKVKFPVGLSSLVSFVITPPASISLTPVTLTAIATFDGHEYSEGLRSVGYAGLQRTFRYVPAVSRIVPVDVTTAPNLKVAYLSGTGDEVSAALEDLGVHADHITIADLTPDHLKPYDAVILGVRAYAAHPDLAAANSALNTYAAAGGVVIAQYDTGRLPEGTGPYPLSLGDSERVVEEQAPVRLLAPENPLLTWPNRITTADFDNWVEERGHGFMGTWDSHYTALLETHDTGQQPQLGGLLVARTGKGAWIYLGLALYRQLPEGVPGPYRLLANLISAARNPALTSTPNAALALAPDHKH